MSKYSPGSLDRGVFGSGTKSDRAEPGNVTGRAARDGDGRIPQGRTKEFQRGYGGEEGRGGGMGWIGRMFRKKKFKQGKKGKEKKGYRIPKLL